MAGYKGYSMSNNAVEAYHNGQAPISKWTKLKILEILSDYLQDEEKILKFKKLKVKELKDNFLYKTSFHHTSKYYNETDFYAIDYANVDDYLNGDYLIINENKVKDLDEKIEIEYAVGVVLENIQRSYVGNE